MNDSFDPPFDYGIGYWIVSADPVPELKLDIPFSELWRQRVETTETPTPPVTPDPDQPPYQRDDLTVDEQRQQMIDNMRSAFNG